MNKITFKNNSVFDNFTLFGEIRLPDVVDDLLVIKKIKLTQEIATTLQKQLALQQQSVEITGTQYKFDCITVHKMYENVFITNIDFYDLDVTDAGNVFGYANITLG